jgi:hypothetical protein
MVIKVEPKLFDKRNNLQQGVFSTNFFSLTNQNIINDSDELPSDTYPEGTFIINTFNSKLYIRTRQRIAEHYWGLNKSAGSVTNTDEGVSTTKLSLTATDSSKWILGKYGNGYDCRAAQLNAANSNVFNLMTPGTLEMWIYVYDYSGVGTTTIAEFGDYDGGAAGTWTLELGSPGSDVGFKWRGYRFAVSIGEQTGAGTVSAGNWYHLAIVHTEEAGDNINIYLDGVLKSTQAIGDTSIDYSNITSFGGETGGAGSNKVAFDDIQMTGVRSLNQIAVDLKNRTSLRWTEIDMQEIET